MIKYTAVLNDTTNNYWIIFLIGYLIRIIFLRLPSFILDVNCFKAWAEALYQHGLSNFYTLDMFKDYPPGYMYILFILGHIKHLFKLNDELFTALIKMPAIMFDLFTAMFLYKICLKKLKPPVAFLLSLLYLINPLTILDSSVWGQVDSVHTFIMLLSIYLLTEKKLVYSLILFSVCFLVKPQALMFSPIYLFAIFDFLRQRKFNKHSIIYVLQCAFCCLSICLLLLIPFCKNLNFMPIINQYISTLKSYPYATVNAYNFYLLLNANWVSVDENLLFMSLRTWGTLFIVVIAFFSIYLLYKNKSKTNYFFVAALINVLVFMFSTKMHERYIFPCMIFFLVAFIYSFDKRLLFLYTGFSMTAFLNCLSIYLSDVHHINLGNDFNLFIATLNLVLTLFMIYIALSKKQLKDLEDMNYPIDSPLTEDKTEIPSSPPGKPEKSFKLKRIDFIFMFAITLVYSIIAFVNLGNLKSPQNFWNGQKNSTVIVELDKAYDIKRVQFFNGPRIDKKFQIETSIDSVNWSKPNEFTLDTVFSWREPELNKNAKFIKITALDDETIIFEMAFRDENDELIKINKVNSAGQNLFDEQSLVPKKNTFMNSTYFDEIYHSRTAYETLNHMTIYETTHPPLGKNIIAFGISVFGMTPFGWRFCGTLFGILMIPIMYIFSKKLFSSTFWATFSAIIFSFDFMHFSQTRIGTVDSYVTLFIILMYLFMYQYCNINFYDTKILKTFIPLFLSGISFGLAAACKWQGFYAAIGLAIIFFSAIANRYREYLFHGKNGSFESSKYFFSKTTFTFLACILFFIIVPLIIYTLSYLPCLKTPGMSTWYDVFNNQNFMYTYHSQLTATHPFSSKWWQWIFDIRPILFYQNSFSDGTRAGISSFNNPLISWFGVIAILYCTIIYLQHSDKKAFFLLIGFLSQYVPWIFIDRATFAYHYFPCLPFLVLMITYMFKNCFYKNCGRWPATSYMCTVILLFVAFYPVLSGMPVSANYVNIFLKWMPTWQLL